MIQRFKQFFSALDACVSHTDYEFVNSLLSKEEERLFRTMDPIDQKHCLDVARTCSGMLEQEAEPVNKTLLLKAALLHDVGKRQGDMSLWDRVAVVLMKAFCPKVFDKLADKHSTPFHVSKFHPVIGAKLCSAAGCNEELVRIVRLHHTGGAGRELDLLQRADAKN